MSDREDRYDGLVEPSTHNADAEPQPPSENEATADPPEVDQASPSRPAFSFSMGEMMLASMAAAVGMALAGFSGPVVFFVIAMAIVAFVAAVLRSARLPVSLTATLILLVGLGCWIVSLLPLVELLVMPIGAAVLLIVAPIVALGAGGRPGALTAVGGLAMLFGPWSYGFCRGVIEAELEIATDTRSLYTDDRFEFEADRDPQTRLSWHPINTFYDMSLSARSRIAGHNWRIFTTLDGGRMVTRFPWGGLLLTGLLVVAQFGVLGWYLREFGKPRVSAKLATPESPSSQSASVAQSPHE